MKLVTLSSKNQITIPKEMLIKLGSLKGRRLLMELKNNELTLKPLSKSIVEETAGSLSSYVPLNKRGQSFKTIMRETKRKVAEHLAKNL